MRRLVAYGPSEWFGLALAAQAAISSGRLRTRPVFCGPMIPLPPLVTTGSPQAAVVESGNLDPRFDPNTRVLFGNSSIDNQGRSGGKFEIGRWFGENRSCRP